jgi:two-component system, cell cycle response regulator
MPPNSPSHPPIRIGILGLTQVERLTVRSVCSLTHSRHRAYRLLDFQADEATSPLDAEIMLVDADDPRALELWRASPMYHAGRPALLISRRAEVIEASAYALSRSGFATRLVKSLDRIVDRALHPSDDVVGGDEPPLDGATDFVITGSQAALSSLPRALIVDDSPAVQSKLSALLNLKGLGADVAVSAAEGMRLMSNGRYAIVFLEVTLPDMDGYTACRRIKAADRAFTPIVMLTHRGSAFDRMRGLMAGCNRYLVKPIAVRTLNKVLHEIVPEQMMTAATASGADASDTHAGLPVSES